MNDESIQTRIAICDYPKQTTKPCTTNGTIRSRIGTIIY